MDYLGNQFRINSTLAVIDFGWCFLCIIQYYTISRTQYIQTFIIFYVNLLLLFCVEFLLSLRQNDRCKSYLHYGLFMQLILLIVSVIIHKAVPWTLDHPQLLLTLNIIWVDIPWWKCRDWVFAMDMISCIHFTIVLSLSFVLAEHVQYYLYMIVTETIMASIVVHIKALYALRLSEYALIE